MGGWAAGKRAGLARAGEPEEEVAAGDRGGARRTDAEGARGRGAEHSVAPSRGGREGAHTPGPAGPGAARAQVQFVHARVRRPQWRKHPRTSCTPNRTMMSCRLPNPRVGRG